VVLPSAKKTTSTPYVAVKEYGITDFIAVIDTPRFNRRDTFDKPISRALAIDVFILWSFRWKRAVVK
jgi:hypothetical protein